jgi:hypothetical protein
LSSLYGAISFPRSGGTVSGLPILTVLASGVGVNDEHPAFEATAGTLQAGVVSLNGVVIVIVGVYPRCVHSL